MPVSLFVCLSAFNYEIPSVLFFYLIKFFVALFEAFVDYSKNVCKNNNQSWLISIKLPGYNNIQYNVIVAEKH